MNHDLSMEQMPELTLSVGEARRLIQGNPDRIRTDADRDFEAMGEGIVNTGIEVHLAVADDQAQTTEYFSQGRQAAGQKNRQATAQASQERDSATEKLKAEYEEALANLKAQRDSAEAAINQRHTSTLATLDGELVVTKAALESKRQRASKFYQHCDELSDTLVDRWRSFQGYQRQVMELRVRAIGSLRVTEEKLSSNLTETTNLGLENAKRYSEWTAREVLLDSLRQKQLRVLNEDESAEDELDQNVSAIADIDVTDAQTIVAPEETFRTVNIEFNEKHQANVKRAMRIDDEIELAKQENENCFCRIVDIRARIEQLSESRPVLEKHVNELREMIGKLYRQGQVLVDGAKSIADDLGILKAIRQTGVDTNFNVSGEAEQWLDDALARYQVAVVLPKISQPVPANDPASIAVITAEESSVSDQYMLVKKGMRSLMGSVTVS